MSHLFPLHGPAINLSLLQTLTLRFFGLTVRQALELVFGNNSSLLNRETGSSAYKPSVDDRIKHASFTWPTSVV